ncbi:leucine-rich repeat protein 1 [Temnothorax longispinosus]|uniref:Peptidylprolyl isomerase-like 5 n=1 Tax=Temnothorax longispinosus TaxID=300112 RepID=A0A4S2L379_9HYME|nr:Peptidylprolyl isomerase-like 5 [Temnothorax longispinosus]
MKFHCTVEIHDRTLSVCSQRRSQSILAFTKKSDRNNEVYLYLQTRQKKQGTRYQIVNNVEQVFTKFIADGKVTIRLTRPCHDLIIQSTSIHVKSFIHVLNLIRNAQFQHHDMVVKDIVKSVTLTPNVFFNSSEFCLVKTKVVVNKKSEYPTLQGFPRTTEQLILRGLDRKSFDRQILRLQSLNVLDLSDNKISYLPREVGTLPHLQQLVLSRNTLGKSPGSKWAWLEQTAIKHTLQFLDISDNSLTELPIQIRNLNALAHLKVSQNELAYLPHNIGALRNLKVLDVARNRLSYLPATITHLRLQFLDVTENPFTHDTKTYVHGTESTTSIRMPSLVDVSAKSILKSRITYDASTIPYTLVEYLDEAKCCYLCRTACFACYIRKLVRLPLLLVEIKTSVGTALKFESYFCSLPCASTYPV